MNLSSATSFQPKTNSIRFERGTTRYSDDNRGSGRISSDYRGSGRVSDDNRGSGRIAANIVTV